jgi:FAD/FMN-containing dehydrogenase
VVLVNSAEDISKTILLTRQYGVSFVVAGGKHASNGAASTNGGLVIDLANLRKVDVNKATGTVKVQGGSIWEQVDKAAAEHDVAMVGGTINHTGVGGLTLGGGYGWLSGRYGLTIDALLEATIVLADGSVVTASKDSNPDLFWAIRGAGHCFGVIADFTFRVQPQLNTVWAGQMAFSLDKLEEVVSFANNLVTTTNGDSAMVMGITAPPFTGGNPAIVSTVFHNGPEEAAKTIFASLLSLSPLINSIKQRPYSEVNGMMNHAVNYGGRKLSKGATFVTPLRAEWVRSILPDLTALHRTVPGSRRSIMLFEFFRPDVWLSVPKDATAHGHRGAHQNIMIGPFWDNAEDDDVAAAWSRSIAMKARAEFEQTVDGVTYTEYGNYDHLAADPRVIFGTNYGRLCEVKRKYDPENVFNKSYALVSETGFKSG